MIEGRLDDVLVRFRRDEHDPRAIAEATLPGGWPFALDAQLRRGELKVEGAPAEVVRRAIDDELRARLRPLLDGSIKTEGRIVRLTFRRFQLTAEDVVHGLGTVVYLVGRVEAAHAALDGEHAQQTDGPFRGGPDPRPSQAAREREVAAFVKKRR